MNEEALIKALRRHIPINIALGVLCFGLFIYHRYFTNTGLLITTAYGLLSVCSLFLAMVNSYFLNILEEKEL